MNNVKSCYIHIPFCSNICSYCDFCKFYYNEKLVNDYLIALECEIKNNYNNEELDTIYIGGGTPSSLTIKELEKLFSIIDTFKLSDSLEFTFECNVLDIEEDKLIFLKEHNVNRLSIGVQSFQKQLLDFLERDYDKEIILNKINLAKKYFSNINVDLIYAIPNESLEMLNDDLDLFLSLDVSHISTYSLIIEEHTKLSISKTDYIDEELDLEMYNLIRNKLMDFGYIHYEISNFCKEGLHSKHNLTYWKNLPYYGFGLGASGYILNVRYTNTKNLKKYLSNDWTNEKEIITRELDASNYAILGFRTIYGVSKNEFIKCFGKSLVDYFGVYDLVEEKILLEDENRYYINPEYWYVLNEILVKFI